MVAEIWPGWEPFLENCRDSVYPCPALLDRLDQNPGLPASSHKLEGVGVQPAIRAAGNVALKGAVQAIRPRFWKLDRRPPFSSIPHRQPQQPATVVK